MIRYTYIKPITEIIQQKEDCFILFSTGTNDRPMANEYEFDDDEEEDQWGNLSGWNDFDGWVTDE
ncbi:MAG: hypothetical protein IJ140_08220 [Prevotella sp.]|nr:hypothetical protein [Prevotella sp.]